MLSNTANISRTPHLPNVGHHIPIYSSCTKHIHTRTKRRRYLLADSDHFLEWCEDEATSGRRDRQHVSLRAGGYRKILCQQQRRRDSSPYHLVLLISRCNIGLNTGSELRRRSARIPRKCSINVIQIKHTTGRTQRLARPAWDWGCQRHQWNLVMSDFIGRE
jgi:hypothetical protein